MDSELLSLDRLPLPSLKLYTCLSVIAASCSIYCIWIQSNFALQGLSHQSNGDMGIVLDTVVSQLSVANCNVKSDLVREQSDSREEPSRRLENIAHYLVRDWWSLGSVETSQKKNGTEADCAYEEYHQFTWQLVEWASQQPHCVWPLVNLALCAVILISHTLQHLVFGTLRTSEEENVKEQFWNLIFYKIVFVFGVVNVQEVEDAVGWCFFVSVIGFLQLARQLCKERHNYLIMMNDMTKLGEARRHRILALLAFILVTSVSLFLAVFTWFMKSVTVEQKHDILDLRYIPSMSLFTPNDDQEAMGLMRYDFNIGLHSAIFMLSEIGLLVLQTLHALTVCIFEQLYFRHRVSKWNPVSIFTPCALEEYDEEDLYMCINHNINYRFEMVTLLFDLIHHCHLLLCCNLFLSMTSLIVSLQMRLRVRQIHAVLKRRQSFTWLNEHIDQYANVEVEESEQDDNCAICWDSLASQKSKILPCNHMFHTTCLRKWLLVSMHCPTCRMSLLSEEEVELRREREPRRNLYQRRPPAGIWGILETGQILLDLFGGWDPLPDEFPEGQTLASNVPVFSDFNVPDCPVQTQQEVVLEQPNQDGPVKKDSEETPSVQSNIKEKGVAI